MRRAGPQERREAKLQRDLLDAPNRLVVDRGGLRDRREFLADPGREFPVLRLAKPAELATTPLE